MIENRATNSIISVGSINTQEDIKQIQNQDPQVYIRQQTVYQVFLERAKNDPHQRAISFLRTAHREDTPIEITNSEILHKVTRTANFFHSLGISEKDCIGIMLPNLPQTFYLLWAAQTIAIAIPLDPFLPLNVLVELIRKSQMKYLCVMGASQLGLWKKAKLALTILHDKHGYEKTSFPKLIYVGAFMPHESDAYCFDMEIAKFSPEKLIFPNNREFSETCTLCISEISGLENPLISFTYIDLLHSAWMSNIAFEYSKHTVALNVFYINTLLGLIGLTFAPLIYGGEFVIGTPLGRNAQKLKDNIWWLIQNYEITHIAANRFDYHTYGSNPIENPNFPTLHRAFVLNYPAPKGLKKRYTNKFNISLYGIYGTIDTQRIAFVEYFPNLESNTSIGWSLPFIQTKNLVPLGEKYPKDPIQIKKPDIRLTKKTSTDLWIKTKDMGFIDKQGTAHIFGSNPNYVQLKDKVFHSWQIEATLFDFFNLKACVLMSNNFNHKVEIDAELHHLPCLENCTLYVQFWTGETIKISEIRSKLAELTDIPTSNSISIIISDFIPINTQGEVNYSFFKQILEKNNKISKK